jgi:mannan polymerase II complex ANP1 subunit
VTGGVSKGAIHIWPASSSNVALTFLIEREDAPPCLLQWGISLTRRRHLFHSTSQVCSVSAMYSATLQQHVPPHLLYFHHSKTHDPDFHCDCRFQPRSQPALRRRRTLIQRLLLAGSLFFTALFFFFPDLRPNLGSGPLSFISSSDDAQLETVRYYDLNNVQGTARGWEREERILLCAPLRDAAPHLPMFFGHLKNLTYPHNLIDLAFLVGDSKDNTISLLTELLEDLQANPETKQQFGEISIMEKDFGQKVNQDVESRHGFAAQAGRRKSMAQARNWLLSAALRPTHSWVYWRDVDVETAPFTILEDLMRHNKDVIVPSKDHINFLRVTTNALCRRLATAPRLAWWRATVRPKFLARVRNCPSACGYT